MNWQTYFIEFSYLLASILFILGLKGLSHPETAKRGMHMAEFGMLMAIIGTLMHFEIVSYTWIIVGLLLGSTLGAAMGLWVPMTAMPQRTALSHAFGAFAAALVGIAEYYSYTHGFKPLADLCHLKMSAMGFVLGNNVLIIAGTLDGFSGFILSILMCRAMNRSITNVLFGAFGSAATAAVGEGQQGEMREVSLDDIAVQLAYASKVVFVPGYGLATAQAQHAVRELARVLEQRGVTP